MSNNLTLSANQDSIESVTRPKTFWEKLLCAYFKTAQFGRLTIELPDHQGVFSFGNDLGPVARLRINDNDCIRRWILGGEIAFGESYVDGAWESDDLKAVLFWFMRNGEQGTLASSRRLKLHALPGDLFERLRHALNRNTRVGSRKNILAHYDLSNEFFSLMLDRSMSYSCAVFKDSEETLDSAQENKFAMILDRLQLKPEHHLLEIGCGWGGFAAYAAEKTGCRITSVTISDQQYDFSRELMQQRGLSDRVSIELKDYRDIQGQYDRIVSIEMVEALGYEYLDTFFAKCADLLKPDGIMVIQAITFPDPYFQKYLGGIDFTQKHIFPGSALLSLREILNSLDRTGNLMVWDVSSIGVHYAKTLAAWQSNVLSNLQRVIDLGFSQDFIRKWIYYLVFCQVGFASRYINAMQITFSRPLNRALFENEG